MFLRRLETTVLLAILVEILRENDRTLAYMITALVIAVIGAAFLTWFNKNFPEKSED